MTRDNDRPLERPDEDVSFAQDVHFRDKIKRGLAAAKAGDFADQAATDRVRNKYRPADET